MTSKDRLLAYLDCLDGLFGVEPRFFPFKEVMDGGAEILCLVYEGVPGPGHLTAVTFGLSEGDHPDWKHGRPELMISVSSDDIAWGLAAAELVRQLRGKCPFSYGDVIGFGEKIASDSEMSAFFVFAPSIFEPSQIQNLQVGDHTIHVVGLYPIYESERDVI